MRKLWPRRSPLGPPGRRPGCAHCGYWPPWPWPPGRPRGRGRRGPGQGGRGRGPPARDRWGCLRARRGWLRPRRPPGAPGRPKSPARPGFGPSAFSGTGPRCTERRRVGPPGEPSRRERAPTGPLEPRGAPWKHPRKSSARGGRRRRFRPAWRPPGQTGCPPGAGGGPGRRRPSPWLRGRQQAFGPHHRGVLWARWWQKAPPPLGPRPLQGPGLRAFYRPCRRARRGMPDPSGAALEAARVDGAVVVAVGRHRHRLQTAGRTNPAPGWGTRARVWGRGRPRAGGGVWALSCARGGSSA